MFVLVHGEFEASRKDRDFPRRMYRYFSQLFLRYDAEVVPIAVFTDDAQWKTPVPSHFELAVADKKFVRFDYHLVKLKHFNYAEFIHSNNPLAFALMAKMDYNRRERVRLKADFLRLILRSPVDPARRSLLVEFVEDLGHWRRGWASCWTICSSTPVGLENRKLNTQGPSHFRGRRCA